MHELSRWGWPMRSSLLIAAVALVVSGCAATQKTCRPLMSWSSPGSACEGAPVPAPVVAEPTPPPPKRVQITDKKIEITEIVQFETNQAVLLPQSEELLNEVADALKEHPEIEEVRVEGHTDSQGGDRKNMKLSEARAKAVRDYLIGKGVDGGRLVAKGFGESKPVADNDTEEGRYKNRRVEFEITKRK
jgi:outer membrane protein OmpA-like peptidoglycan-associated protein